MGFAQAGKAIQDGDHLAIQGAKPSGVAMQGNIVYRGWRLLTSSLTTPPSTVSVTMDTTGATLLIIVGMGYDLGAAMTVSDSLGNTWIPAVSISYNPTATTVSEIFYCVAPTVGTNHTFTYSRSQYSSFAVLAFKGPTAATIDTTQSAGNGSITDSLSVAPLTPAANNCLLVSSIVNGNTGFSIDNGFQLAYNVDTISAVRWGGGVAYQIQPTQTTVSNLTWSSTPGTLASQAMTLVSFKPT